MTNDVPSERLEADLWPAFWQVIVLAFALFRQRMSDMGAFDLAAIRANNQADWGPLWIACVRLAAAILGYRLDRDDAAEHRIALIVALNWIIMPRRLGTGTSALCGGAVVTLPPPDT